MQVEYSLLCSAASQEESIYYPTNENNMKDSIQKNNFVYQDSKEGIIG